MGFLDLPGITRAGLDTALAGKITDPASDTAGALNATYAPASGSANYPAKADVIPKWKAATAYASGDKVVSPSGDIVTAKTAFTSGASYDAANWDLSANVAGKLDKSEAAASYAAMASPTGIDPTGVTEATAAINTALTANTGKTVFIPRGLYLVDTINVPAGTTLLLDDRATLKLKAGAARAAVSLNGNFASVRAGSIDGNASNQTVNDGAPLVRISADDCTVERLTLTNVKDYGIRSSGHRSRIRNNNISGGTGNPIFIQPGTFNITDPEISGNRIDRTDQGVGLTEGGIKVHNQGSFVVTGARISNNTVILPTNTTLASPVCIEVFVNCDNATVTGNTTIGGRIGISIAGAKNVAVSGNTCTINKDYGIEFAAAIRCTATGNTVDAGGIGGSGISCNSAAIGCAIAANTVIGAVNSSIKVEANCSGITITGNSINATAAQAIEIISSTHITIAGNTADGNSTALKAVMLNTSWPATVTGNTFRRFTQNGVLIYATSAVTINFITVTGNTFDSTNGALTSQLSGGAALGSDISARANAGATDVLNLSGDVRQRNAAGTPEGAYAGGPGSIYLRTDTGNLYMKATGTGTTGWKLVTQAP